MRVRNRSGEKICACVCVRACVCLCVCVGGGGYERERERDLPALPFSCFRVAANFKSPVFARLFQGPISGTGSPAKNTTSSAWQSTSYSSVTQPGGGIFESTTIATPST